MVSPAIPLLNFLAPYVVPVALVAKVEGVICAWAVACKVFVTDIFDPAPKTHDLVKFIHWGQTCQG